MFARSVVEGVDLFVTRRVRGREMRLRPSRQTNQTVGYIVAVIAKKYGVSIHAICVLSDHYHIVIHDWFGRVVDFTRDCHSFIARVLNHAYGDNESLWSSSQTNHVRPVTPADTVSRIAYTMANPVKHNLVKFGRTWPGIRRAWPAPPKTYKRPKHFFKSIGDDGTWPDYATLIMERPLGFEAMSDNELAILIHEAIQAAEDHFRQVAADENKGFIGHRAVKEQSRYSKAKTRERKRRRIPRIACADPELRAAAIEADRAWRACYRDRLKRWRRGERDVVFPHGTYKMRVVHGVRVAPPT